MRQVRSFPLAINAIPYGNALSGRAWEGPLAPLLAHKSRSDQGWINVERLAQGKEGYCVIFQADIL